jgi:hypothetical protein
MAEEHAVLATQFMDVSFFGFLFRPDVPPKRRLKFTGLQDIKFQMAELFKFQYVLSYLHCRQRTILRVSSKGI